LKLKWVNHFQTLLSNLTCAGTRRMKEELECGATVLTPVRRSARKAEAHLTPGSMAAMLESTG
jgi:hypothetical protein